MLRWPGYSFAMKNGEEKVKEWPNILHQVIVRQGSQRILEQYLKKDREYVGDTIIRRMALEELTKMQEKYREWIK